VGEILRAMSECIEELNIINFPITNVTQFNLYFLAKLRNNAEAAFGIAIRAKQY